MAEDLSEFRYARHLLLDGWDQAVLRDSSIVIVGVGALGCELAKNLALVGVGRLVLVDMDTIETSNLSRQMLFHDGDRGRNKAEAASEKLKALNPDLETEVYTTKFQEMPRSVFEDIDLIAGGLDSFTARFQLNKLAWELGKIYIDSAATGFKGNVQVIIPPGLDTIGKRTACLKCFYPVPPADDQGAAACTIPGEARTREHCVIKGEEEFTRVHGKKEDYSIHDLEEIADLAHVASLESPHIDEQRFSAPEVENIVENKLPAVITVNAVVASIQSHEVLKAIHRLKGRDIGPLLDPSYLEYNAENGIFTALEVLPDDECSTCSSECQYEELEVRGPTLADLRSALEHCGIPVKRAMVTRSLNNQVISNLGAGDGERPLSELGVGDGERIRITYSFEGKRTTVEMAVDLED